MEQLFKINAHSFKFSSVQLVLKRMPKVVQVTSDKVEPHSANLSHKFFESNLNNLEVF